MINQFIFRFIIILFTFLTMSCTNEPKYFHDIDLLICESVQDHLGISVVKINAPGYRNKINETSQIFKSSEFNSIRFVLGESKMYKKIILRPPPDEVNPQIIYFQTRNKQSINWVLWSHDTEIYITERVKYFLSINERERFKFLKQSSP